MTRIAVWREFSRKSIGSLSIAALAICASVASAADDPPPLIAPGDAPATASSTSAVTPPESKTQVKPVQPDTSNRPVLALPGLNVPNPRGINTSAKPTTPPSSLSPDQTDALPPLISPIDHSRSAPALDPIAPQPLSSQRFRPRIIESAPRDMDPSPSPDLRAKRSTSSSLNNTPSRSPANSGSIRDLPGPRAYDDATGNRSRVLNLFNPPRGPRGESESSISTEPRSDPAADAALKRRIEKQAAEVVGTRVKEVEVRVIGRVVTIQAKGTKFLQKRAVKRALEGLPALSGYKAVIDVRD